MIIIHIALKCMQTHLMAFLAVKAEIIVFWRGIGFCDRIVWAVSRRFLPREFIWPLRSATPQPQFSLSTTVLIWEKQKPKVKNLSLPFWKNSFNLPFNICMVLNWLQSMKNRNFCYFPQFYLRDLSKTQWIRKWKWHFPLKWEARLANLNWTPLMGLNQ